MICCDLHKIEGCCDTNDCGPCCENCPTCPTLQRQRAERAAAQPTDEELVSTVAEHLANLVRALAGAGVEPGRSLQCASRALIDLDQQLLEAGQTSAMSAAPQHGKALVAIAMLRDALGWMTVKSPLDLGGEHTLVEMFEEALEAMRGSVEAHWTMLMQQQQAAPKLIVANGHVTPKVDGR